MISPDGIRDETFWWGSSCNWIEIITYPNTFQKVSFVFVLNKIPSDSLWLPTLTNLLQCTVIHMSTHPSKELCSKMTLGEVGASLPWWCHTLLLPAPGYWGLFGQSWSSEISAILPYEIWFFFQSFNFDLKFLWNWSFFHYEKITRFKKSLC